MVLYSIRFITDLGTDLLIARIHKKSTRNYIQSFNDSMFFEIVKILYIVTEFNPNFVVYNRFMIKRCTVYLKCKFSIVRTIAISRELTVPKFIILTFSA